MNKKKNNYLERTAKFLQDINVEKKVLLMLFITFALFLPLLIIEEMNPIIHRVLLIFTFVSTFVSAFSVFIYLVYFLFLKKYLDTAETVLNTAGTAIDTVAKVKNVHKLIKAPDFTKAKELISKVKGFKMPKLEIKKKLKSLKFLGKGEKNV